MSDISVEEINDKYIDVLKEIGNIGAGNATTAIANMLSLKVDMSVPMVDLTPVEKIGGIIGSEEDIIVGIMLGVGGKYAYRYSKTINWRAFVWEKN